MRFSVGDYRRAVLRLEASLSSLQDGVIEKHFHLPYKSSIATSAWLAISLAEQGRRLTVPAAALLKPRPQAMRTASLPRPAFWASPCSAGAIWRKPFLSRSERLS